MHNSIFHKLLYALLFAFGINVFNTFFYIVFLMLFIVIIKNHGKIKVCYTMIFLGIWSLLFAVIEIYYTGTISKIRELVYLFSFVIGFNMYDDPTDRDVIMFILLLGGALSIYGMLNFAYNYENLQVYSISRSTYDFWSKEITTATAQASYFAFFLGTVFWVIYMLKQNVVKFIWIIIFVVSFTYNLMLAGRTYFGLLIISLVVGLILLYSLKDYTYNSHLKHFPIISGVILFFSFAFLLYYFDAYGIQSKLMSSNFYTRFFSNESITGVNETGRLSLLAKFSGKMTLFYTGGMKISNEMGFHVHNLWLDNYDQIGTLPFCFLIIYTCTSIRRFFKIINSKVIESKMKVLIISVYVVLFVKFMLEPVLSGIQWLYIAFCMFDGLVSAYIKRGKYREIRYDSIYKEII